MAVNKNCILRLSRYKSSLYRLKSLGFVKVFSDNLADAVGVSSVQVRKDFSIFGISGNKRGGYQIDSLIERLNAILGKDKVHRAIVVGTGHIGMALMKYKGFEKEGIQIVCGFDIDPAKYVRDGAVPVLPLDEMKEFVRTNEIRIGIIAVPDLAAQQAADSMVSAGVKGILNFAPLRLRVPTHIVINNVNLATELENVIYFVNVMEKEGVKYAEPS
jgi:redox-sensing transcriptional repressor